MRRLRVVKCTIGTGYCSEHRKTQESRILTNSIVVYLWCWLENSGKLEVHSPVLIQANYLSLSPKRRALSHNSRLLSHKSTKIRKHPTRDVQNIKKIENRPSSHKVMWIWKRCHFFDRFCRISRWPKIWRWYYNIVDWSRICFWGNLHACTLKIQIL